MIDIMPDSYGVLMQFLSRRSRLDAAGVALEQFGVQGLLQSCDLHADARLGRIYPSGRFREASFLEDSEEIFELLEIHNLRRVKGKSYSLYRRPSLNQ